MLSGSTGVSLNTQTVLSHKRVFLCISCKHFYPRHGDGGRLEVVYMAAAKLVCLILYPPQSFSLKHTETAQNQAYNI